MAVKNHYPHPRCRLLNHKSCPSKSSFVFFSSFLLVSHVQTHFATQTLVC